MDALAKLGIDGWGLLLYLVNFGVLLFLMKKYVYAPLVKMLDERRDRIKEDVEKASEMRVALKKERAEEVEERKQRLAELDERIQDAKSMAREEAKKLISEAETQRDAILAHASQTADATIAATIDKSQQEIIKRVQRIVTHVLEEGVPEKTVQESVQKSWDSIAKSS